MLSGDDIVVLMSVLASAIALAGFASLVTSIDRNAVGTSAEVISFQVRNLIVGAWGAALLSLFPIALDALQIAQRSLWQCASMIGSWVLSAVAWRAWTGRRNLRGERATGFSRALFAFDIGLSIAANIVAVLGAAGAIPGKGAFLMCVFYLLILAGTLFYRMIQLADEAARGAVQKDAAPENA